MRFAKRRVAIYVSAAAAVAAFLPSWAAAGTSHVAIGRYESLSSAQGKVTSVVGETLLLVGRVDSTQPYLRIVTLDPSNGARKGSELNRTLPQGPCYPANPLKALYSRHFLPGYCLIVGAGVEIATLPLAVQSTGTPVAGSWGCLVMPVTAAAGRPTAVTEIAGSTFGDGRARLFVATDSGRVLEFYRSQQGSIILNGQHDLGNGLPVSDLGALPQSSGILLGVAAGHQLSGWKMGSATPQLMFRLSHPQGSKVKAFRLFEPGDRVPGASDPYIHIAFCDGRSDRVFYSNLPTTLLGNQSLDVRFAPPAFPMPATGGLLSFTGSLLLLVGPQGDVHYKLGYLDGSSAPGCMVNVSEPYWQPCVPCPIVVTGDVDNSGSISASDLIRLVGFVFKGGGVPQPCRASGDVDCSGAVNASDVISVINYVFKGGRAPCNVCSLFSGTWSCP